MAISNSKITQYQTLIDMRLGNVLDSTELKLAKNAETLKMYEAEAGGDGSADKLSDLLSWVQTKPLAMKYFTTVTDNQKDFISVIDGTATLATGAAKLPSTYITLHAETPGNEAKLDGLIALRSLDVDPTFKDDGANLAAGSGGTTLDDATVMALHGTWGATKYKNILNKGVLKAIENETDTDYDTLGEIDALYDAWANTVDKDVFLVGLKKMVDGGVTGIKFSELYSVAGSQADFDKYTSDAAVKLMASTGGTWAGVTGLSSAAFDACTSKDALTAIDKAGANFTLLSTVYAADTTKFDSLLAKNSLGLMTKGYSGIDYSGLSTGYGTTYTTAADVKYNTIVDPAYSDLFKNGASYANMASAYDAGKLSCFTKDVVGIMDDNSTDFNTTFGALVGMTSAGDFAGLETLGNGTICA